MKTSLKSVNFWSQLVTLILSAFVIGGLNVNYPVVGPDIVEAIVEDNYLSLLTIFAINILNPLYQWIKTLRVNPKQFWLFLYSVNFWVSAFNVFVSAMFLWGGIEIPTDAAEQIVVAIMDQKWIDLLPLLVINILIPIAKIWIKKKPLELK